MSHTGEEFVFFHISLPVITGMIQLKLCTFQFHHVNKMGLQGNLKKSYESDDVTSMGLERHNSV